MRISEYPYFHIREYNAKVSAFGKHEQFPKTYHTASEGTGVFTAKFQAPKIRQHGNLTLIDCVQLLVTHPIPSHPIPSHRT
jgi:hypothetical protein